MNGGGEEIGASVLAARALLDPGRASAEPSAQVAIYRAIYAGGWRGRGPLPDAHAPQAIMDARFVAEILDAEPAERFGCLWTVESVDGEEVTLTRDGLRAWAQRAELDREPVAGERLRVAARVVSASRLPGFVHRFGAAPEPPLSRVYAHLEPDAARWFVSEYGSALDARGVGYELKVLAHPLSYFRGDAAVLIVSSHQVESVAEDVVARTGPGRLAGSPVDLLLTRRVAPGIAVADQPDDVDPSGATSHGMWVADLLHWAAARLDEATAQRGAALVAERLADLGRDEEAPWRRAASPASPGEVDRDPLAYSAPANLP